MYGLTSESVLFCRKAPPMSDKQVGITHFTFASTSNLSVLTMCLNDGFYCYIIGCVVKCSLIEVHVVDIAQE